MSNIDKIVSEHIKNDDAREDRTEKRFERMEGSVGALHDKLDVIKDNHLVHLASDVDWVKKIQWGILAGLGTLFVIVLGSLLLK